MTGLGNWTASWRLVIEDRVNRLKVAMDKVPRGKDLAAVQKGIHQASAAARVNGETLGPLDWIGQWMTGSAVETAWRGLHRAEEEFVLVAEPEWVMERLSQTQETLRNLGIIGPAATPAQKGLLDMKSSTLNRGDLKAQLEQDNVRSDSYHSDLRNLRNILLTTTILLLAGLAAMAVAGALAPNTFSLCGGPTSSPCNAPTVLEVEIAGGFGGLLSAVVFLTNLRTQSTPYAVWFFQGLLKAPTGAALALIVVFLVQTGLVGFLKAGPAYVIPYALVFGFAQQAATQLVDNWASAAVDKSTPSKAKTTAAKPK